ncbi:MAG: hypothetical protein A2Z38_06390 [Planctomycetes bacterium RBG_19FT_COMBO_48_8]|nr:MAG: hypothetical protein A2Z38_06390 [Planctomycetes bacterium RBG_19FT_COMBO_48_8]
MGADARQRVLILDDGLASFRAIERVQHAVINWMELMKKPVPLWRAMIAAYQKMAKKSGFLM